MPEPIRGFLVVLGGFAIIATVLCLAFLIAAGRERRAGREQWAERDAGLGAEHCLMCGTLLPHDRRWTIASALAPRFPRCNPPTEACYRGLAARVGAKPSDAQVADALRRSR
jgi:hypothetical protein